MSKRFFAIVSIVVLALALLPTGAALADGLPTNPIITVDQCVLTVEFDAQVPGIYTVNIWDAGEIIRSQSQAGAFFGDTLVFQFLITEYVYWSAPGVAVEIVKNGVTLYVGQIGTIEPICKASLTGCTPSLTAGAVVGRLNANTQALWAPSFRAPTDTILEVGTTWWVLGTDTSGRFYEILVSCQPVWVPASAMGPNFDEVWNGRPLPSDVIHR
jgi:hypothetical protein